MAIEDVEALIGEDGHVATGMPWDSPYLGVSAEFPKFAGILCRQGGPKCRVRGVGGAWRRSFSEVRTAEAEYTYAELHHWWRLFTDDWGHEGYTGSGIHEERNRVTIMYWQGEAREAIARRLEALGIPPGVVELEKGGRIMPAMVHGPSQSGQSSTLALGLGLGGTALLVGIGGLGVAYVRRRW